VPVGSQLLRAGQEGVQLGARKLGPGQQMTSHPGIVRSGWGGEAARSFGACTWNLFHGRDHPPDPALFTWRSRLWRRTERNATHVQVNRPLRDEFATVLAGLEWDIALLQETPPRWLGALCRAAQAHGELALTSRNELGRVRRFLADLNPDLIASNEGGSNMVLVRAPGRIGEVRRVALATRPERRAMLLARVQLPEGLQVAVACMHLSVDSTGNGPQEALRAAEAAVAFAGDGPLLFGGDMNLRPHRQPEVFAALEDRFGLAPPTAPGAIDHLLARGLGAPAAPWALPPSARELPAGSGRRLQLSDHTPVEGRFEVR
jgi:endonuclease/exonuclease/phosphatase family metal-dependent hydrolase